MSQPKTFASMGRRAPQTPRLTHSLVADGRAEYRQGDGVRGPPRMASSLIPGKSVSFDSLLKFSPLGMKVGQGFRGHPAQIFPLQMGRLSPREADGANCSGLLGDWMTRRDSNPGLLVTTKDGTPGPFLIACEPRRVFAFLTGRKKKKGKGDEYNTACEN